jgi:plasmid maintenance system antidote protein VapI
LNPAELRNLGEQLYGPRWQTPLARALPVSPRTVRYWLSGKRAIRPVIAERIKQLVNTHGGTT